VAGAERWLDGHSTPERMADGSVLWDGFLFDITERRRAEDDLRENRQLLEAVTDNIPGPIARLDRELRYTYVNKLYGLLYDRSGKGLIGRTMPEVIGPEAYGRAEPFVKRALGGERVSYENFLTMPSGEKLHGLVTLSPDIDAEGRITGLYMVALDITERRNAEEKLRESLNNLNRSEKISGAGSWSWDIAADRFIASPEGLRLWGFGPDERPSFAEVTALIHPDDLQTAHDVLVNSLRTGEPYSIEIRIRKKGTGEVRHLLSVAEIETGADGRAARVFGVNRDISERVKNETALRESEEKYRVLVEEINDVVYALDGEGVITFMSPAIAKITALTPGEITHRPFSDFIHPDDLTMVIERYKRYIDGDISPADFRIRDGRGGYVWVRSSGNPVYTDGQFAGVRGTLQNITEVKQAEKELREREEMYRAVVENSHNAIAVVDDGFRLTYVNDEFCRLSGYGREELTGRNFAEFLDEKSFALGVDHYRRRQAGEDVPSQFEFGFIRKDGAKRLGEVKSTVYTDSYGRVNSLVQILDITERRRAENELRESEKKYRELVEHANSIILRMKRDGTVTFFNEYAEKFFGYRRDEIIGENVVGTIVPPGDSAGRDLEKMIAAMGSDPDRYAFNENENVKKDGSRARIAWTNRLAPGEAGAGDEILCVGTDITERARAEEQLRLQAMVLDQINDCVTVTDLDGRITYVNDAECRNLKLSREELLGKNVETFGDDPEKGPTQKDILEATLSRGRHSGEVVNYDADGREIIMEFSTHLVRDSRGEPVALCGISSDITERKKAEQELREREEKFRALAEYSHNAIIIIDDGGVVTYVNDELCRISGYSKDDIVGGPFAMAIAPESVEMMVDNYARRQRGENVPSRYEFYLVRKDGEKRLMEASATVFRDSAGRVNSIGQLIDIT
ncbi:MAG TPA: PAS domain S-box protein, partial [Spirochaetes bacterium]|nr:PAS domain S-box protein [Spirochaetota bacterium]